jgi:hypothetical protein
MDLARCILAGAATAMLGVVVFVLCVAVGFRLISGREGIAGISVEPQALVRSPYAWAAALLLFGIGFWAESRRGK